MFRTSRGCGGRLLSFVFGKITVKIGIKNRRETENITKIIALYANKYCQTAYMQTIHRNYKNKARNYVKSCKKDLQS